MDCDGANEWERSARSGVHFMSVSLGSGNLCHTFSSGAGAHIAPCTPFFHPSYRPPPGHLRAIVREDGATKQTLNRIFPTATLVGAPPTQPGSDLPLLEAWTPRNGLCLDRVFCRHSRQASSRRSNEPMTSHPHLFVPAVSTHLSSWVYLLVKFRRRKSPGEGLIFTRFIA